MNYDFYDTIRKELEKNKDKISNSEIEKTMQTLSILKRQQINILFVGGTGVGKSSTINAIFNTEIAKVGEKTDPETSTIDKFEMDNLILWDTPGLGDSPENDKIYAGQIANALLAKDNVGNFIVDAVVVVIDGSGKDMGTTYELLENIVVPYLGDKSRIVLAINQCDVAMKGRLWDYDNICPMPQLVDFLEKKVESVHNRVLESCKIDVQPVYYSALHHYNISKLLLSIIESIPENKRFLLTDGLNRNPEIWQKNDDYDNYNQKIQNEIKWSVTKAMKAAADGAIAGATIGSFIPVIGTAVGAAVGAIIGGIFGGF